MQKNGILIPYRTTKGHNIALLRNGILTVSQIFDVEHTDARWETWKLRGAGIFVMYASAICLKRLLRLLCKVIYFRLILNQLSNFNLVLKLPIFHQIERNEISLSSNLAISVSISLLIMSIAWLFYRPMIGIGLILAALSPIIYCSMTFFNGGQNQDDTQHQR